MRFGQDQSTSTIGNRGGTWRIATSLLVLTIVLLTASPIATIAQGEGLSTAEVPAEAPAVVEPVAEQPTAVPVQPTSVPPTAVPPTAVPPTVVPPTAIPTAVPTQVPPTAVPTAVPTQEPTAVPTEKVWANTDSLRVTDGVTTHTVQQGAAATVSITYTVTTPRSSTTIYARLSGATDGWTITTPQLPDADPAAMTAAWTQSTTLQPGTAFTLPLVITAPATVSQDQAVSLHLWSVAAGEKGQETGVAKTDLRFATITALAPPPTPTPTIEPTAVPTETPTIEPTMSTPAAAEPSEASEAALVEQPKSQLTANTVSEDISCTTSVFSTQKHPFSGISCAVKNLPGPFVMTPLWIADGWEFYVETNNSTGWVSQRGVVITGVGNNNTESFIIRFRRLPGTTSTEFGLRISVLANDGSSTTRVYRMGAITASDPVYGDVTIDCGEDAEVDPGESKTIACTFKSNAQIDVGVTDIFVKVNQPSWTLVATDDGVTRQDGKLVLENGPKIEAGKTATLRFNILVPAGCTPESVQGTITLESSFTFEGATSKIDIASESVTVTVISNASGDVQPTVSMADFDFDDSTWDGQKWPTTYGTGVIKPTRTGCGGLGEYEVQVKVRQSPDGIRPSIDSVSVPEGASATGIYADPNEQPVTVATIDGQFTEGNISVTFELTPDPEVPAGTHNMTFEVTTLNVQD